MRHFVNFACKGDDLELIPHTIVRAAVLVKLPGKANDSKAAVPMRRGSLTNPQIGHTHTGVYNLVCIS